MAHGSTLSQYVAKQIATRKPDQRDEDPRAAILRHAEEAAKDPYWSGAAYAKYVIYSVNSLHLHVPSFEYEERCHC